MALCVTATRGTSVGAADVPVVPAKGDVTIRLNWWGGDARIKAMREPSETPVNSGEPAVTNQPEDKA